MQSPLKFALLAGFLSVAVSCGPTKPPCSASTCNGCCDLNDTCQSGLNSNACGSSGLQCVQCQVNQICEAGFCINCGNGSGGGGGCGGAGGGSGGGAGGGSGSGENCTSPKAL